MGTEESDRGSPPEANERTADSAFTLAELWLAILNNRWLVVAAVIISVAGTAAYTKTRVKLYSSTATIRMDPEAPKPLGESVEHVADIKGDYWDRKEYYNTEFQIIQAKSTVLSVVKEFSLHRNPGFINGTPHDKLDATPYVTPEVAAGVLQDNLSVSGIKDSRLATVSFTDTNPARAARILRGVLDAYAEVHRAELNQTSNHAEQWLGEQVEALRGKLEQSEQALHNYKKEKSILSLSADDQTEMLKAKMAQLTAALTDAEAGRAKIGARRDELRKIKGDNPSALPATELTENPLLRTLREKYVQSFETVEAIKAEGKGEGHPAVASAMAQKFAAQKLLLEEVANIKASVEKDYTALSAEIGSLQALYSETKQQALDLNLHAIEYKRLERARNTNQDLFDLVSERSKQTGLTSNLRPSNVRVVDAPEISNFPNYPNVPLNMMGGLMGGLLLGLGLALGKEQLDSTLRRPEVVESVFGMPFLGLLPAIKDKQAKRRKGKASSLNPNRRAELTVHYDPTSGMAEAARAIRTNVLLGPDGQNKQVILMTSAAPGDGKTTVACSLAISLAQSGQRVALLDCDLRRPRLHRVFEVKNDFGLVNILRGTIAVADVERGTVVENLTLLPSGAPPQNPAELLHSEHFATLLRDLRGRYDRIVIDSPPLIPVADATILATLADATIIVARAFETKKHTARRAARVLQDVGAQTLGAVLNAVDFDRGEYRYYQYYDYHKREETHSNFPARPSGN